MAISLKNIQKEPEDLPPRILLYGVHGIGKSEWVCSIPNIVFGLVEDGLPKGVKIDRQKLNTFDDVMDFQRALYEEEHSYEFVAFDTLDRIEELLWKKLCVEASVSHMDDVPYGRLYPQAVDYWKDFIEGVNLLRTDKGMGSVLIGHSKTVPFSSPDSETYNKYELNLHISKSETRTVNVPQLFYNAMDVVGFVNYKTHTTKEAVGQKKIIKVNAAAPTERILYLAHRGASEGKNRYGFPDEIPFERHGGAEFINFIKTKGEK